MRRFIITALVLVALACSGVLSIYATGTSSTLVDLSNYGCIPVGCPGSTEGIVIGDDGDIYFTMFFSGEILKATPEGKVSHFAQLPGFAAPGNAALGLAMDRDGDLYAAVAPYPTIVANEYTGIYKISHGGKKVDLFANGLDAGMGFPNFPAFDKKGNLFVSDSHKGSIYKVTREGQVSIFVTSPLLHFRQSTAAFLSLGANGLAFDDKGDLFVGVTMGGSEPTDPTNPFMGSLVKIGINADGTLSAVTVVADSIGSPDGIAFDQRGNLYIAQPLANSISVIDRTGQLSLVASGPPLSMPASLAIKGRTIFSTNLSFGFLVPIIGPPGLSKVELR